MGLNPRPSLSLSLSLSLPLPCVCACRHQAPRDNNLFDMKDGKTCSRYR